MDEAWSLKKTEGTSCSVRSIYNFSLSGAIFIGVLYDLDPPGGHHVTAHHLVCEYSVGSSRLARQLTVQLITSQPQS